MALSGSLAGYHPSIKCKDGMVRCNVGLAKLDYVDLITPSSIRIQEALSACKITADLRFIPSSRRFGLKLC